MPVEGVGSGSGREVPVVPSPALDVTPAVQLILSGQSTSSCVRGSDRQLHSIRILP